MAFARLVNAKFKPGKRDEAIKIVDDAPKEKERGFQGILTLLPTEDPDSATFISVWDSEEALNTSQKSIYQDVMNATKGLMDGPPEVKNVKVRVMRGQLIPIRV